MVEQRAAVNVGVVMSSLVLFLSGCGGAGELKGLTDEESPELPEEPIGAAGGPASPTMEVAQPLPEEPSITEPAPLDPVESEEPELEVPYIEPTCPDTPPENNYLCDALCEQRMHCLGC